MLRDNNGENPTVEPGTIVFKKYGKNRRIYDTSAKRYVNLEEVAAAIRSGANVRVVDAETSEDLTRVCLMQIVMDDSKDRPTGLPLELLRQLIIVSDHVGREFIMWYLQSAFDAYRKMQNALETGITEVQSAAKSPVQLLKNFIQSSTSQKEPAESTELQELRNRVAELEARRKSSKPARAPRRKSAKSTSR